ncbi:MAG: ribosomal protein [Cytophagaceae bacterium]|jgi:four helix bundle protein|nr:ribosomal protein [Cytophagaceae bacterium]
MFDFEKLLVYQKAKSFNQEIYSKLYSDKTIDRIIAHQLRRAAISVPLNIAEGTSRFSKADRKNFYVIARGSVFECVAIFDLLKSEDNMPQESYATYYEQADELSKMLYAMIKSLN